MFLRKHAREEQSPPPKFDTDKLTDFFLGEMRHKFESALADQQRVSNIVRTHDFPAFTKYLLQEAPDNTMLLSKEQRTELSHFFHKFCIDHGFHSDKTQQTLMPTREELKELIDSFTLEERWLLCDGMSEEDRERFVVNYFLMKKTQKSRRSMK